MNKLIFDAVIQWVDDGMVEAVSMSTYPTEGLPEDEQVFFSFFGYDIDELIEQLDNWNYDLADEWKLLQYDKQLLIDKG